MGRSTNRRSNLKKFLAKRDGQKCFWCEVGLHIRDKSNTLAGVQKRLRATVDHLVPRSRGGSDKKHNLVLSCPVCNGDRENYLINPVTKEPISAATLAVLLAIKEVK